eukprot:9695229-Ditylum_brightwellii.AAC.1
MMWLKVMKVTVLQKKQSLALIAIRLEKIVHDDSTDKQPNQDMTSTTSTDSDREDGSKDSGKMPAIERFFNGINSSSAMSHF